MSAALPRHLVIMAAGTGGHVVPGLAVAHEMQQRGWSVSWLGTTHGMENRLVAPSGIPIDRIAFSGLRGKGMLHALTGGIRLLAAFWSCLRILRRRRASAVLGMGGYVCFPGGLMASLLSRPLLLVNADAALLLSNRALLPVADAIAFGFDGAAARKTKHAVVTGNPVRAEIEALPPPGQRGVDRRGRLHLLVVGGSLGARALNDCMPQALALLRVDQRPQVTHQTGQAHAAVVALAAVVEEPDPRLFVPTVASLRHALAVAQLAVGDRKAALRTVRGVVADDLAAWPGWRRDRSEALMHRLEGSTARPEGSLTAREREVAALIAEGLTNGQLAERLFISPKTAAVHVSNILTKLGLSGRAEVAAWSVRHGLVLESG